MLSAKSLKFIIPTFVVFSLLGCDSDNGSGPSPTGKTTIKGRVTNDSGYESLAKANETVKGAMVSVIKAQADGSVKTVSTASVETDANGEFAVETKANNERGLIVVAEKADSKWKGVVASKVTADMTTTMQPINIETTVEAEIEQNMAARRSGDANDARYADIAAYVNPEIAASVKGNVDAMQKLTAAIDAEAGAYTATITHAAVGESQADVVTANKAKMEAQANLGKALYKANGNQAEIDAAFAAYYDALIRAHTDAGIALESHAKAKETASHVMVDSAATLNSDVQFQLERMSAKLRAQATSRATEKKFSAMAELSGQTSAVADAGSTLQASVDNAKTRSEISAAFDVYHDAIVSALQSSGNTTAAAMVTADASINGTGGAAEALQATVSATGSSDVIINAYTTFFAAVRAVVKATLVAASEAEISAATEILILANMSV